MRPLCLLISVTGGLALGAPAQADSVPFWGAKSSVPIDTSINKLKKGEFLWMGEAVTTGPVVMVVSITEQRGYVYRNGVLIGATTVSTGRPGHLTPTGVFTVLQKQKEHRSTIYDGAQMPYMERLTWGGIALHAGGLPGYPESHGCTVPDPFVPDPTKFSWLRIGVPGHIGEQGTQVDPNAVARIKMPAGFAARINGILTPGATLFVTNEALYPQTSGPMVQVVDADPPTKSRPVRSPGS
jgi:hypothetical protein